MVPDYVMVTVTSLQYWRQMTTLLIILPLATPTRAWPRHTMTTLMTTVTVSMKEMVVMMTVVTTVTMMTMLVMTFK